MKLFQGAFKIGKKAVTFHWFNEFIQHFIVIFTVHDDKMRAQLVASIESLIPGFFGPKNFVTFVRLLEISEVFRTFSTFCFCKDVTL